MKTRIRILLFSRPVVVTIVLFVHHAFVSLLLTPPSASSAAALIPSSNDDLFHSWCDNMGIGINPSVRLVTTSKSVAGRGVFAVQPLTKNEIIAYIPTYMMFHTQNAQNMFPHVAKAIQEHQHQQKQKQKPRRDKIWHNDDVHDTISTSRGKSKIRKFNWRCFQLIARFLFLRSKQSTKKTVAVIEERPWQVDLTEYALEALKQKDHPMTPWIKQWQRDDPVYYLFSDSKDGPPIPPQLEAQQQDEQRRRERGDDDYIIEKTAHELHIMMIPEIPIYKIMAALNLRLEQYYENQKYFVMYDPQLPETAAMYTTLCSRTIGIAEDIVAAIPFHDMINHSFQPNVGLAISDDGEQLEIMALTDIGANDELFLCYFEEEKEYDEDAAVWMLIQWGIPASKEDWKVTSSQAK